MRRCFWVVACWTSVWMVACVFLPAMADDAKLLWQIGTPDDNTAEFALAPNGYGKFREDPLFVIGVSDERRDWPYVHPGPADTWAEGRPHAFSIVFAIDEKPENGTCRLQVDLVDTHDRSPARLRIDLNGREMITHATPPGGPDASIMGQLSEGREHRFSVDVPIAALKSGANEITIRSVAVSWVLYDWIGFEGPADLKLATAKPTTLVRSVRSRSSLVQKQGKLVQVVEVNLIHVGPPVEAEIRLPESAPIKAALEQGSQVVELLLPAVEAERQVIVEVAVTGKRIASRQVTLRPVRRWVVYLLPHSHVDIGYTQLQTKVEQDHWRFLEQAIEASRRTADYPPGAQYKWNVEVLWAVDSYLKQAAPEEQREFVEAVQKGWIGLDALYGNQLTALCRPEELVRLLDYSQRLSQRCGVKIDSAMITDVPGYTWGLISVLGEAGVKYMSMGPNSGARIGFTHAAWDEKPFYWVSPCGRHKVLCWIPEKGYYRVFTSESQLLERLKRLEAGDYPYDVVQLRYCLGDNHGPSFELSEMVKEWNTKYAYPKLIIGTTSEMMRDLQQRHGDAIPEVRGDFTPYWEDGAASSALETSINRASAERLAQAETIFAITRPHDYPADDFYDAWRNVLLYDEHTWGAHNSISQPDSEFAQGQWKIKQAFALDGDKQSRALLAAATAPYAGKGREADAVLVFNTSSWPRTDLVVLPKEFAVAGDLVKDSHGKPVPSQRLSDGSLAFVARDVPGLGAKRFSIAPGNAAAVGSVKVANRTLSDGQLTAQLDAKTGAIESLRLRGIDSQLVDGGSGLGLNDYFYVAGTDPKNAKRNGPVKISVKEPGPLVGSLLVECDAPGCRNLSREIRLVSGLNRLDIVNIVDKEKIRTKEGVHFAFPLNVPSGVMRMDIPWAVARPELDQIAGACKNWFTVQRWIDTSNDEFGVTWATIDAPLVEVGAITAEIPWIEKLEPTQTLYSYVMNNYWFTNYKADQEGPTPFRYSLKPHVGGYNAIDAARFGIEQSQPLVAVPTATPKGRPTVLGPFSPWLTVEPADVIVAALKPSNDGKAWIIRLFGAGGKTAKASLTWSDRVSRTVWLSDLTEEPKTKIAGPIEVPAYGMVTLRAELPE